MKLRKTVSFMLALTLIASMSVTNVFASATSSNAESESEKTVETEEAEETPEDVIYDTENGESVAILPESKPQSKASVEAPISGAAEKIDSVLVLGEANNKVTVELPKVGDTKTFDIQIDHSLYPEARLCVFTYGALGDCTINVSGVRSYTLSTKASGGSTGYNVKEVFKINGSGGVKNYTVTVSTTTGNAACALILATEDTLAEMCGGRENAASIQKNVATQYGLTFTGGVQSLLKGEGEWFRYTADGDTFIHAYASMIDDYTITVYDADTGVEFNRTGTKDLETQRHRDTAPHCGQATFQKSLHCNQDMII